MNHVEVKLFDAATIPAAKEGERPAVPMWSHQQGQWVFNGKLYGSDDKAARQADWEYMHALMDYADYLEQRIKDLTKAGT